MQFIYVNLPDISSVWGIIFYSFITYIFLYGITYIISIFIEDNFNYEKRFHKRIIKNREIKEKEAERMAQRLDPKNMKNKNI